MGEVCQRLPCAHQITLRDSAIYLQAFLEQKLHRRLSWVSVLGRSLSGYSTALCSGSVREVKDVSVQLKPNAGYEKDYKNVCTKSSLLHKDTQSHN